MDPKERDVGTMGYLSLGFSFHFSSCSKSKAEFYYLKKIAIQVSNNGYCKKNIIPSNPKIVAFVDKWSLLRGILIL